MANPSAIDGGVAVLVAGTGQAQVALNPDREYTVVHDGEDAAGAGDTNTIYLATDGNVDADASEGADKFKLKNGRAAVIGPGKEVLKFKCAAGAPTFSVDPGPRLMGNW